MRHVTRMSVKGMDTSAQGVFQIVMKTSTLSHVTRMMSRVWMSHVTRVHLICHKYECVVSREFVSHVTVMNELKRGTCLHRVCSRWRSRGTHMNESWHTYEWVMTHVWTSHGPLENESWHTYKWVMAHVWMSHSTRMNESWLTWEWVMSTSTLSHGRRMNESWHTYAWVMSRVRMSHIKWILSHGTRMTFWHGTRMNMSKQTYYSTTFNKYCGKGGKKRFHMDNRYLNIQLKLNFALLTANCFSLH